MRRKTEQEQLAMEDTHVKELIMEDVMVMVHLIRPPMAFYPLMGAQVTALLKPF